MENTEIRIAQKTGAIEFNFEELKSRLVDEMKYYKGLIFSEDTKKEAKETVADLRKLKKDIRDKRIEVKKSFMHPYDEFEAQVKELDKLIDEPIAFINEQVEEFERKRVEERKKLISEIYTGIIAEHETVRDYLPFQRIYDGKWENATTTKKAIKEAITGHVEHVEKDLATIRAMESEFEDKGLAKYKSTLELSDAIGIMNQYQKQKEEILKRQKEEAAARKELEKQEAVARTEAEQEKRIAEPEVPVAPTAPAESVTQEKTKEEFVEPKSRTGAIRYEVIADPFQIAQLESAMREYGIEFRRV